MNQINRNQIITLSNAAYQLEEYGEAKKVLVANALGDTVFAAHFRQRAKDMRINLIENVQNMKEKEIDKAIGLLWCT